MGMGTVLFFPAEVCAAALATPEPLTGTGHPTSVTGTTGQWVPPLFPHCLSGRMETWGMQVTAKAQVLPSLVQLCLLITFSWRRHSPAP